MTPDHDGELSWFNFTLSDVPPGYDITNGVYPAWCVQQWKEMDPGPNHQVLLKSCYAANLENGFELIDWEKINYIINHKQEKNRVSVQRAIWYFTDDLDNTGYPGAQAIVNDTMANSSGYIPQAGELLAVAVEGYADVLQLAFLELVIPIPNDFEGLVWYDTNLDGLQGENENGISGVTVQLYHSNDTLLQTTTTNTNGNYIYNDVPLGEYYLQFTQKPGHKFTLKDAGSDDTLDSDADTSTGKTIVFTISADESITIWDAGMYKPGSGGEPEPPEETPSNTRPTADATAGEPYRGFINGTITFNGSRSYDFDGRIISWRWIFGDGNNGTGEITTHIYTIPGNYNVSLLVMDDDFATDMHTTTAIITSGNNPPATPVIAGPLSGHATTTYHYTIVAIDPDGDNLRYFINWGDDTQDNSSVIGSGVNLELSHQWATPGFYTIQVYAQDTYEEISDIAHITVAIDVKYVQNLGYLIDSNGDGTYERFHSNETGVETTVKQQPNGRYLIDTDGDGQWNTEYDPESGQTQDYRETPILQYALIILIVLIITFLLLYLIIRNRRRSRTLSKNQESEEKEP
jgi:hypothetical protein